MAKIEERAEDQLPTGKDAVLSVLFSLLALAGFTGAVGGIAGLIYHGRAGWEGIIIIGVLLWIGGIGAWGLKRLKPWAERGPISPATRKTNSLFALAGVIAVPGTLALALSTMTPDDPFALFSNSPVPVAIALVASGGWLISMLIGWWWHFSVDEHERQANEFGAIAAGGLIATVTPAWWVAARAGLVPEPDAMILWSAAMLVWTFGWFWHRYR